MKKNERLRKRFGSVVTAGLVASALVAAPATMLVGAVPAMAEGEPTKINDCDAQPAAVSYGHGWNSIDLDALSELDPGEQGNEAYIYINADAMNRDRPLVIGFKAGAKNVPVSLYLRGHEISNTYDGGDLWIANAIVANCNLTINDYEGLEDSHPWKGTTAEVGQVCSKNGCAVITEKDQVTINGGLYSSNNWQPLFGDIKIDSGAFLSDPRESVPGSAVGRNIATSQTASDPNATTYWLVGEYANNAWGSKTGGQLPPELTSDNVVTIKQMQHPQDPNISRFNVKELINEVNYSLHVVSEGGKCDGIDVPRGTILSPGGHLSRGLAFSGGKISVEPQTHTGNRLTPAATVTDNQGHEVDPNKYYLMYQDNVEVGTAQVEAIGLDEYGGSRVSGTFEIKAAPTPTPDPKPEPEPEPQPTPTPSSKEAQLSTATSNVEDVLDKMDKRRYTDASVKALEDAQNAANKVLGNKNSTEAQISAALKALNDAYTGLVHKSGVTMNRLYNPNSGEHFYTASTAERDHLVRVGWRSEGTGWTAPASSNTPVYRLYNPNAGDHHYTTSAAERDNLIKVGWNYEGIGWFSDDAREVPLWRQYNPNARAGAHNFTASKAENDHLVSVGWRAEGIGWYGMRPTA